MTTITGDNVTYTKENIFEATGGIIERNTLTANSTDTLCSALDIIGIFKGTSTLDVTGKFLEFYIYNNSNFEITTSPGTGMTMKPGPTDTVYSNVVKKYTVIITSSTTCDIFNLDYNGTAIQTEKIITNTIEPVTNTTEVTIYENIQNIIMGDSSTSINNDGSITLNGNIFQFSSVATITAASDITYSVGQILGGYIKRDCSNSDRTDTLPTAADIVAAIPKVSVGTSFLSNIQNVSAKKKVTIVGGTGVTVSGDKNTISKKYTVKILFVITNKNSGTEAVTAYLSGTLGDAEYGAASLITTVTTNSYTVLESDNTINVDTNTIKELCTITLPDINIIGQKRYFITDLTGKAGKYNIKIVPYGTDTIAGSDFVLVNSNYTSISMYNNEVDNWILY